MGVQDLTVQMVVIVVIGVFFASFMDAIAGGGGIISVPTYLLAGLPMHLRWARTSSPPPSAPRFLLAGISKTAMLTGSLAFHPSFWR